MSKIYFCPG